MNPLNNYPKVRAVLYLIQWVIGGITTVLSAFFTFTDGDPADWPRWFLGALAILPVMWTYLGITAQANTPTDEAESGPVNSFVVDPDEPDDEDVPLPLDGDGSVIFGDGFDRGYDPADHNIEEVKDYVTANPDQGPAVLAAERNGEKRVTLIDWLDDRFGEV